MPSQDIGVSLQYSGAYHRVETEVFAAERIKVQRGDGDEGAALRPAKVNLTFDNRTDKYRPSNPMSPLYGVAGRNTPMQITADDVTLTTVEATSWAPDHPMTTDRSKGRWAVDVEGFGLLGRISQWSDPLHSPFFRFNQIQYGSTTSVGYFSLEDVRNAKTLFTPTVGASTANFRNLAFESSERPSGSDPLTDFNTGAFIGVNFVDTGLPDSGFQVSWAMRYDDLPGAGIYDICGFTSSTGIIYSLAFQDGANFFLQVSPSGGPALISTAFGFGSTDFSDWVLIRMKVTSSAGTVSVETAWFTEATGVLGSTQTFSGTTGSLKSGSLSRGGGSDSGQGITYGHFLGVSTGADDLLSSDRIDAFLGHPGETVGDRFLRIMGEESLTAALLGTAADTRAMGAQRGDTLLNLLQEMARTDDALIFDSRDAIGLTMRTRVDRYNQTPALALTFGANIAPPFEEILDDLETHNRIVMSQRDGGDYETALESGSMSTQPPPAGVGEYKQQIGVCVETEATDLPVLGGWYLNRGTLERSRYATVTVNLAANPELIDACNALEIGDLITVGNYEAESIPLIVIGFVDTIGWHNRRPVRIITYTTRPADLFAPGVLGTMRLDSTTTTTAAEYSPSATSIAFSSTSVNSSWSTTATPYDVTIVGERVTVTAMGAVSGTGPYLQTATVRRGVNGVNKTLPSGSPAHVSPAVRGRYAL